MKKMKLLIAIISVFALAALAGCSGGGSTAATSAPASADTEASASAAVEAEASADMEAEASADMEAEASADMEMEAAESSAPMEEPAAGAGAVADAVNAYWANFPAEGANQLPADKIFEKMDAGEDIYLLDIRSPEDYAEGHLKGAVNIPYGQLGANLEAIPDDKDIWINCYTGQTSSQATVLLSVAGKKAHNIQSGWMRGITQAEGYENYIDTEEAMFEGSYPVDPEIKAAIEAYFASDDKPFNFEPADLKAAIDGGTADQYTIVSVRQAADYDEGHIPGAMNIPFGNGMQASFGDIPMDKQAIVYCYTGQTASQVVASLRMLGYDAWNLSGGMGKAPEGENPGFGWLSVDGAADLLEAGMAKAA